MITFFVITNLNNAKTLAAKMRRWSESADGYAASVRQVGNGIVVEKGKKPWAELAGHMTNNTQIYPCRTEAEAIEHLR